MSRLTEPKGDNGGKNAWRHLNDDELRMVAQHAAKHGQKAAKEKFGISNTTVMRAGIVTGIRPLITRRRKVAA